MSRLIPFVTTLLFLCVICSSANADPDRSLVRVAIADESSTVAVSGRTRVNVVQAVMRSLKEIKRPCATVSVGPWLQLPVVQPHNSKKPTLTVCIDDRLEAGKSTAYIALSADVPFDVVCDVTEGLNKLGYDARLISEETLLKYITESQKPLDASESP